MPETNFTITQGTMTITEYGNSVPFTQKLDNLSLHPVREVVNKVLKNDAKKALDTSAAVHFNATPLRAEATAGTSTSAITLRTNGTATLTNAVALGTGHVKAIVDVMKERNIPAYSSDDYFCIAWPTTYRTMKNSLESIHQYVEPGFRMILRGEIGRYEGVRFIEQTNAAKGTYSTKGSAWGGGSDWAFFFGKQLCRVH